MHDPHCAWQAILRDTEDFAGFAECCQQWMPFVHRRRHADAIRIRGRLRIGVRPGHQPHTIPPVCHYPLSIRWPAGTRPLRFAKSTTLRVSSLCSRLASAWTNSPSRCNVATNSAATFRRLAVMAAVARGGGLRPLAVSLPLLACSSPASPRRSSDVPTYRPSPVGPDDDRARGSNDRHR